MTKRVEGKIAVVTGGAVGMGRTHARTQVFTRVPNRNTLGDGNARSFDVEFVQLND